MTMERKKSKLKMIQKLQLHHQYQAHPQEMDGLFFKDAGGYPDQPYYEWHYPGLEGYRSPLMCIFGHQGRFSCSCPKLSIFAVLMPQQLIEALMSQYFCLKGRFLAVQAKKSLQ